MNDVAFWKLDTLSDRQLLEGLGAVLGSGRRLTAELVAHLGELEERRLHLEAACSSMFSYCVNRLGLSEDEACRRIEVARLARRHPSMFPLLASGQLSLSVAALLKPHLSADNPLDPFDLLAAVTGKSVQQAREVLAVRFPRPDVPSRMRKLPERRVAQPRVGALGGAGPSAPGPAPVAIAALSTATQGSASSATVASTATHSVVQPSCTTPPSIQTSFSVGSARVTPGPEARPGARDVTTSASQPSVASRSPTSGSRAARIEPLAAQRYKVQFTADTELKGKLELARDLMRHAHPSGDFAPIIGRALDLLIEDLMKRRFGSGARRKAPSTATPSVGSNPSRTAMPSGTAKPSDAVAPCATPKRSGLAPSDALKPSYPAKPSGTKKRSDTENARDGAGATVTANGDAAMTPSENDDAATAPSEKDDAGTTPCDVARRSSQSATSRYVRRAARRSVLERDGLRCSWVDAGGVRCDSRAWLEHDHRRPRGKGGDSEADNLRLLCRAHNCLAAEREYGRQYVERAVARKRWERARPSQPPPPR